ncbi:hypothetical protein BGY98DRAFT_1189894 [Russula aff. rugulosa BPL654]|nr:hypothetical protein BGY98DRAFT_1189894 [Russula aff. rugulosa BPL654]
MLLDEVLLEIFACYVEESKMRDAWHTLACVCRRWRSIALGSPRRLNLRIFCSERILVRDKLDLWPPFPIVLTIDYHRRLGGDNILATLEHHDRVCEIAIWNISNLNIRYTDDGMASLIPDSFLGGSAPRLRRLNLEYISFPGLPKLLLSATDLVHLELYEIPDSGYIPADAMATCLSTLTRLEFLMLCFESPRPLLEWERRHPSSSTRTLLPSLTSFAFRGVSEYLEDIVDRIDAPLLDRLIIRFFHQPIFDTPRLARFISRLPEFMTCNEARMRLGSRHTYVKVLSRSTSWTTNACLVLEDWHGHHFQLSPLWKVLPSSEVISTGHLGKMASTLAYEIAPRIALVLQMLVGESVMELFPVLQNIFLKDLPSGVVPEGIKEFVTLRQLVGHPISISG